MTFANDVQGIRLGRKSTHDLVFGDGKEDPVVIAGDLLYDEKYLQNTDRWWKHNDQDLGPIEETHGAISNKLFELYEEGQTALGMLGVVEVI